MRQRLIIASLGTLAATGLAVYLIRKRRRNRTENEETYAANSVSTRNRSKAFSKPKAFVYEPDDHPE